MQRFFLAVVLMFAAGAVAAAPAPGAPESRGHILVQRYCAGCHAVNPTGKSPNPAAPAFRNLNERYRIDDLGEALAEGILTGHPAMPQFVFPPDDIKAILRYLKSIQSRQEAAQPLSPAVWDTTLSKASLQR
jgi:mono/diheme cytochrome c family protein